MHYSSRSGPDRLTRSRLGRPSRRAGPSSRAILIEHLEARHLLAIDMDWNPASGRLSVEGDDSSETIRVDIARQGDLGGGYVSLNGDSYFVDDLGAGYRIPTHQVTEIALFGRGGDDLVDARMVTAAAFPNLSQSILLGGDGNDIVLGTQIFDSISGGPGNDRLNGNDGDDRIEGGAGDDNIGGGGGDDTFLYWGSEPLGADFMGRETSGSDTLDFSAASYGRGLVIDLSITSQGPISPFGIAIPSFRLDLRVGQGEPAVENIIGTRFPDHIVGNQFANVLMGLQGNDTILGAGGADILGGGEGDDRLAGFTLPESERGNRTPRPTGAYSEDEPPVQLETIQGGGELGDDVGDQITGNEGNDRIWGDAGDDLLFGGGGHDEIHGEFGDDQVFGGSGDDRLHGDLGDDRIVPSQGDDILFGSIGSDTYVFSGEGMQGSDMFRGTDDGVDTLDFSSLAIGVTFDLGYFDVPQTLFPGVSPESTITVPAGFDLEDVVGSPYADTIHGNSADNRLVGDAGDDLLIGDSGNDTLEGGVGDDQLYGSSGGDVYRFTGAEPLGTDHVYEDVRDLAPGSDTLDFSGVGIDVGIHIDLSEDAGGFILPFGNGFLRLGLRSDHRIENVLGTERADWIGGDSRRNELFGFGGDDILMGIGNDDLLHGGDGNDRIYGGVGFDQIRGGAGDDLIEGGMGHDLLEGESGNDQIHGQGPEVDSQPDIFFGGDGDDQIVGGPGPDELHGGHGGDLIQGESGEDIIYGDEGSDHLYGGAGDDAIRGGDGDDILDAGGNADQIDGEAGEDKYEGDLLATSLHALRVNDATNFGDLAGWTATDVAGAVNGVQVELPWSGDGSGAAESEDEIEWTLSELTGSAYEVYATWSPVDGAAAQALFTVQDGIGRDLVTSFVDQRVSPTGLFVGDTLWQHLGVAELDGSNELIIRLSNPGGAGTVLASALRVVDVSYVPPAAIDDEYAAWTGIHEFEFNPMANDRIGDRFRLLTQVTDVQLTGDVIGSISILENGDLLFQRNADVDAGVQAFSYTLTDDFGNSASANGKIRLLPSLAGFRVEALDLSGQPLGDLAAGEEFQVRISGRDLRGAQSQGVSAGILELSYSSADIQSTGDPIYATGMSFTRSPSIAVDGGQERLSNIAFFGNETLDGGEFEVFRANLVAQRAITAEALRVSLDLPESLLDDSIALRGESAALPYAALQLSSIGPSDTARRPLSRDVDAQNDSIWQNRRSPFDVNNDGAISYTTNSNPPTATDNTIVNSALGSGASTIDLNYVSNSSTGLLRLTGPSASAPHFVDVNGDGYLTSTDKAALDYYATRPANGSRYGAAQGDFDGDGQREILVPDPINGSQWWVHDADAAAKPISGARSNWHALGDFDGDRRTDLAQYKLVGSAYSWQISSIEGSTMVSRDIGPFSYLQTGRLLVGDFDGNGSDDLLQMRRTGSGSNVECSWEVGLTQNGRLITKPWGSPWTQACAATGANIDSNYVSINVLDLNGDGRDDVLAQDAVGRWRVWMADSTNFFEPNGTLDGALTTPTLWNRNYIVDLNGDGVEELLRWNDTTWERLGLNAAGQALAVEPMILGGSSQTPPGGIVRVGDIDGDGGDELYFRIESTGSAGQNWYYSKFLDNPNGADSMVTNPWSVVTDGIRVVIPDLGSTLAESSSRWDVIQHGATIQRALGIYSDVYNNIRLEIYPGAMKGAEATADTLGGNPWDQATLLSDRLAAAHLPNNIVRGRVSAPTTQVMDWLGVTHPKNAEALLKAGMGANPVFSGSPEIGQRITFDHVWVELQGANGNQHLDPSWKFRHLQSGIPSLGRTTPLNVTGANGFLSSPDQLPFSEVVEKQIYEVDPQYPAPVNGIHPAGTREYLLAVPLFSNGQLLGHTLKYEFPCGQVWCNGYANLTGPPTPDWNLDPNSIVLASHIPINSGQGSDPIIYASGAATINGLAAGFDVSSEPGYLHIEPQFNSLVVSGDHFTRPSDIVSPTKLSLRTETIAEFYRGQLNDRLAYESPGKSLSEVPYDGPIQQRSFASPPGVPEGMGILSSVVVGPSAELVTAGVTHRVTVSVHGLDVNGNDLGEWLSYETSTYTMATKSVVVIPTFPTDGSGCGSSVCKVDLYIDSAFDRSQTTTAVPHRLQFTLSAAAPQLGQFTNPGDYTSTSTFVRELGPAAIAIDAWQHSERSVDRLRTRLNESMIAASSVTTSVPNAGTQLKDRTLGYLAARYWQQATHDAESLIRLNWAVPARSSLSIGLVSSANSTRYLAGLSFPHVLDGIYFDMPGSKVGAVSVDVPPQGTSPYPLGYQHIVDLVGKNSSNLENSIPEEFSNSHFVSTIKAFQIASIPGSNIPLHTLRKVSANSYGLWTYGVAPQGTPNASFPTCGELFAANNNAITIDDIAQPSNSTMLPVLCGHLDGGDTLHIAARPVKAGTFEGGAYIREQSGPKFTFKIVSPGFPSADGGKDGGIFNQAVNWLTTSLSSFAGDPVNLANGNFFHEETDVDIPNKGVPLRLTRRYDSSNKLDRTGLGIGWSHTFSQWLEIDIDDDPTVATDPPVLILHDDQGQALRFPKLADGTYGPPESWRGVVKKIGNSSSLGTDLFVFEDTSGMTRTFERIGTTSSARLRSIFDRSGNGILVTYSSSTATKPGTVSDLDNPARAFQFTYVSTRLDNVTDFSGRKWKYTVSLGEGFNTLARIDEPSATVNGQSTGPSRIYGYTAPSPDLAGALTLIDPSVGGSTTIAYFANRRAAKVSSESTVRGVSKTVDQLFVYADIARRTRFTDERGYTTIHHFDAGGSTIREVFPDGSRESFVWVTNTYKQLTARTTADNLRTTFSYYLAGDLKGELQTTQNWRFSLGVANPAVYHTTAYSYFPRNGRGTANVQSITVQALVDGQMESRVTTHIYHNSPSIADPGGATIHVMGPSLGLLSSQALPDGATTTYQYSDGLLIARQDPRNSEESPFCGYLTRTFVNSPDGQLLRETATVHQYEAGVAYPAGPTFTHADVELVDRYYNSVGHLTAAQNDNSIGLPDYDQLLITYERDKMGRLLREKLPRPYTTTINVNGFAYEQYIDQELNYSTNSLVNWVKSAEIGDEGSPKYVFSYPKYDAKLRASATATSEGRYEFSEYDEIGNLVRSVDNAGRETRYGYDARNRLVWTMYPDGAVDAALLDGAGRSVATIDARGEVTAHIYDGRGMHVKTVNADGGVVEMTRDDFGNLKRVQDERGFLTINGYDSRDRLIWTQRHWAGVTEINPDTNAQENSIKLELLTFHYDAHGNEIRRTQWDPVAWKAVGIDITGPAAAFGKYFHTYYGPNLPQHIDPHGNFGGTNDTYVTSKGRFTDTQYDELDRPVMRTNPDGGRVYTRFDRQGRVEWTKDEMQRVTRYRYDNLSRLRREIQPSANPAAPTAVGFTREFTRNIGGDVIEIKEGLCAGNCADTSGDFTSYRSTLFEFDTHHNEIGRTDTELKTWTSVFDGADQLVVGIDPLQRATHRIYDERGRVVSTRRADPDGGGPGKSPGETLAYDANGNIVSSVDPRGYVTRSDFDAMNRRTRLSLPYSPSAVDGDGGVYREVSDQVVVSQMSPSSFDVGTSTAQWTLPNLPNGVYRVFAAWNPNGDVDYGGKAKFTLYDGDVSSQVVVGHALGDTNVKYSTGSLSAALLIGDAIYVGGGKLNVTVRPERGSLPPEHRLYVMRLATDAARHTNYDRSGNASVEGEPRHGSAPSLDLSTYGYPSSTNYAYGPLYATTVTTHDGFNRALRRSGPDPDSGPYMAASGNPAPFVEYAFDSFSDLRESRDQEGRLTSYRYDKRGRLIEAELPDPDGAATVLNRPKISYTRDLVGNTLTETRLHDPRTPVTRFEYDNFNRRIATTEDYHATNANALNRVTTFQYDIFGNLERTYRSLDTLGAGQSPVLLSSRQYDRLDRPILEIGTDPDTVNPQVANNDIDGGSNLLADTRAFFYDAAGNLVKSATLADESSSVAISFIATGTSIAITGDALLTSHTYDRLGRPVGMTDPNNVTDRDNPNLALRPNTVFFEYDAAGNRTAMVDAVGNRTEYQFNSRNLVVKETRLGLGDRKTEYDAAGNVTKMTDALGRERQFSRDYLGRVAAEIWPTAGGEARRFTNSYDTMGRTTRVVQSGSASPILSLSDFTYSFDTLDRLTQTTGIAPSIFNSQFTYEYFLQNSTDFTIKETFAGSEQSRTSVRHDRLDRVTSLVQSSPFSQGSSYRATDKSVQMTYDSFDRWRTTIQYAGAIPASGTPLPSVSANSVRDYDLAGRAKSIQQFTGSANTNAQDALSFDWDRAGRMTSQSQTLRSPSGSTSTVAKTLGHDRLGQLTSNSSTAATESFQFDETGNPNQSGTTLGPQNQILNDGANQYRFDKEGNRRWKLVGGSDSGASNIYYEWDQRNRLVRVFQTSSTYASMNGDAAAVPTVGAWEIRYQYDHLDQRIAIQRYNGGTLTSTRYFVYENGNPTVVMESPVLNPTFVLPQTRYLHGRNVDQIFAKDDLSSSAPVGKWYWTDHQGSVRHRADFAGVREIDLAYGSYGGMSATTPSGGTATYGDLPAFTGREWDGEAGLYNYRARWYDPAAARFLSADPMGPESGDENPYRYVGNAPMEAVDPSGMIAQGAQVMSNLGSQISASFGSSTGHTYGSQRVNLAPEITPQMLASSQMNNIVSATRGMNAELRQSVIDAELFSNPIYRDTGVLQQVVANRYDEEARSLAFRNQLDAIGQAGRLQNLEQSRQQWNSFVGISTGVAPIAGGFIPGVGETQDAYVIFDSNARWWERGLAGVSLGANIFTVGLLPNFGGAARAAKRIANSGSDIAHSATRLADPSISTVVRSTDSVMSHAPNRGAFVSNGLEGAAFDSARRLTSRQHSLLSSLSEANSQVLVRKSGVSMNDLRNLTLHTGDEFAIMTRGSQRLVLRGQGGAVPTLSEANAALFRQQDFRLSGHTHTPGYQAVGSDGDKAFLRALEQRRSGVWGAQFGDRPGVFYGNLADEINARLGIQ